MINYDLFLYIQKVKEIYLYTDILSVELKKYVVSENLLQLLPIFFYTNAHSIGQNVKEFIYIFAYIKFI